MSWKEKKIKATVADITISLNQNHKEATKEMYSAYQ